MKNRLALLLSVLAIAFSLASNPSTQTIISNNAADMANHIVMVADSTTGRTVSNLFTFNRGGTNAPYAVGNAGAVTVTNLDADLLDAQHGSFYQSATNLTSGTIPTARLGSGTASVETFARGDQTWAAAFAQETQGRLTLTTVTPVTVSDVTAATTVYFSPYGGNRVATYNGSNWKLSTFSEISIAVPATTNTMYDMFLFDNAGTIALEALAWTNDTTRATALVLQDGVLEKSGATTRKYLGSFRTTTVSGQTEDSFAKRFVWNYYNRVERPMRVLETTDSWNYSTATLRQANGAAANQLAVVVGVAEVAVTIDVQAYAHHSVSPNYGVVSIGEDSTTTTAAGTRFGLINGPGNAFYFALNATLRKFPAVGYHTYVWLEAGNGTVTLTWIGDDGGSLTQSGIIGLVMG